MKQIEEWKLQCGEWKSRCGDKEAYCNKFLQILIDARDKGQVEE